ncbi:MAG: lytic transglycosylase domain-containing protein [bacterium]
MNKIHSLLFDALTAERSGVRSGRDGAEDFQTLLAERISGSSASQAEALTLTLLARSLEFLYCGEEAQSSILPGPPHAPFPLPERALLPQRASVSSPARGPVHPASTTGEDRQFLDSLIEQASSCHGVDPVLIRSVIMAESGGDPWAVSSAGAQGLMQLMPETAKELGVTDPFDPAQNIMAGTRYLRQLLDRYQGDVRLALAAYNWGMGNLEKSPGELPAETRDYLAKLAGIVEGASSFSRKI